MRRGKDTTQLNTITNMSYLVYLESKFSKNLKLLSC